MNNNLKSLFTEFERIRQKGWICSITKSTGAIGITFERELGKSENSSFLPDYNDIEIKCMEQKSLYPITLFSLSFDGPGPRELHRIVDLYGYPDKTFKNKNILYANLSCKYHYFVNNRYYFKLEANRNEEKIYLVVQDRNHNIIDRVSYITFASIKNRLMTKMKKFALIYGIKRYQNNNIYFKYTDILLFYLQDSARFIDLLETNEISASVAYRINKSMNHFGKPSSKNIVFTILPTNLNKLFEKLN